MVPRLILQFASLALVSVASAHAGSIEFTGTAFPDRVVLNLTIVDDGGAPDCANYWILRNGEMQYLIPRTPGTSTYEFVDTTIQPNTQYAYDLKAYEEVFIIPSDQRAFEDAFGDGWHGGFRVYANWGPVDIGKGRLVYTGEPWSSGVGFVFGCGDSRWAVGIHIPDEALHYVDSGQPVFVRGYWFRVSQQHGDGIVAQEIVIDDCPPTAVEPSTWSGVKNMYRQP